MKHRSRMYITLDNPCAEDFDDPVCLWDPNASTCELSLSRRQGWMKVDIWANLTKLGSGWYCTVVDDESTSLLSSSEPITFASFEYVGTHLTLAYSLNSESLLHFAHHHSQKPQHSAFRKIRYHLECRIADNHLRHAMDLKEQYERSTDRSQWAVSICCVVLAFCIMFAWG